MSQISLHYGQEFPVHITAHNRNAARASTDSATSIAVICKHAK